MDWNLLALTGCIIFPALITVGDLMDDGLSRR